MTVVQRARRPGRVYEFVMKALLNVIDDLLLVRLERFAEQARARRSLDGDRIEASTHSRQQVLSEEAHDSFLVLRGHRAIGLTLDTLGFAVAASWHTFSHRQVAKTK